jgi:hypothetical protein
MDQPNAPASLQGLIMATQQICAQLVRAVVSRITDERAIFPREIGPSG